MTDVPKKQNSRLPFPVMNPMPERKTAPNIRYVLFIPLYMLPEEVMSRYMIADIR